MGSRDTLFLLLVALLFSAGLGSRVGGFDKTFKQTGGDSLSVSRRELQATGVITYGGQSGDSSITITADANGQNNPKSICRVSGAVPRNNQTNHYENGALSINVPAEQTSTIYTNAPSGSSLKLTEIQKQSSEVTVDQSGGVVQSVAFHPDGAEKHTIVRLGLFEGSSGTASCAIDLYFSSALPLLG